MKVETSIHDMAVRHKIEYDAMVIRQRKELRELQKQCKHTIGFDQPFPNKSFVRCLNCHKSWDKDNPPI